MTTTPLLQELFANGSEARIRDLRRLRRALRDVRRSLASEAFERGWFTGRAGTTPWPWWAGAAVLAVLGVVVGALVLIPVGGAIVVLGLLAPRLGRGSDASRVFTDLLPYAVLFGLT